MKKTLLILLFFSTLFGSCDSTGLRIKNDYFFNTSVYEDLFQELSKLKSGADMGFLYSHEISERGCQLLEETKLSNISMVSFDARCNSQAILIHYDENWRLGYFPCEPAEIDVISSLTMEYWILDDDCFLWYDMMTSCQTPAVE